MYNMYLDYGDLSIGKYKVRSTDMDKIYNQMAKPIILDGFKKGFNVKQQIYKYKLFLDKIHKLKKDCYKIKASDFILYLSCYMCLYKLDNTLLEPPIILKIKNTRLAL